MYFMYMYMHVDTNLQIYIPLSNHLNLKLIFHLCISQKTSLIQLLCDIEIHFLSRGVLYLKYAPLSEIIWISGDF